MREKMAMPLSIASFFGFFYLVGLIASALGLPVYIDYGETISVTRGSGRYSYDEDVDGAMTDIGLYQIAISAMLAWRIYHIIRGGSLSGGLSVESRRSWTMWVMGFTSYVVFTGVLSFLHLPDFLFRCLSLAALAGVFFFFKGEHGTALVRRVVKD